MGIFVTLCHTPADAATTGLALGPLPEDVVFK